MKNNFLLVARLPVKDIVLYFILFMMFMIAVINPETLASPDISFGNCNIVGIPGSNGNRVLSVAVGDLDNDGYYDIVSGDADEQVTIFQNDSTPFTGNWPATVLGTSTGDINGVALGDLDGDGDLDIVSGGHDDQLIVWQNDGSPFIGTWTSNLAGTLDSINRVALGDLDGDNDIDIVTGDILDRLIVWRNDGTPFTGTWTSNVVGKALGDVLAVVLGDLDRDKDLDIVSNGGDYNVVIWQNDGTPFQGLWIVNEVGKIVREEYVWSLALGDFNNDKYLDIVSGDGENEVLIWHNDATPFSDAWAPFVVGASTDEIRSLAVEDLDNDNDKDIISADYDGKVIAWENPGIPFKDTWYYSVVNIHTNSLGSVAVADIDNDNDADIVSGEAGWGENNNSVSVCENRSKTVSIAPFLNILLLY
jgi:hypothetical protein